MKIGISSGAEADVADGYWFYERQSLGLGDYFRSCIFADIESLVYSGDLTERLIRATRKPMSDSRNVGWWRGKRTPIPLQSVSDTRVPLFSHLAIPIASYKMKLRHPN